MRMAEMKYRTIVVVRLLAALTLVAGTQASWGKTEKQPGLPNFGSVAENLYRGGQPTSQGFNTLRAMGIGIIVNFRNDPEEIATEKREVESLGMKYVEIPWSANYAPQSATVLKLLDLIRANPDTKIFVHCRRGADRTGVMIASYRIAIEHKSVSQAVSEMHNFHYDWLFRRQLQRYVEAFPSLLENDPLFADYRPQTSSTNKIKSDN
jgi:tyrosine-protein phosphatase SIW14